MREVEHRIGLAEQLAACIADPRAAERVQQGLEDIIRFRLLKIAAGHEDGNDAERLWYNPLLKLANGGLSEAAALCSQPTLLHLENTLVPQRPDPPSRR